MFRSQPVVSATAVSVGMALGGLFTWTLMTSSKQSRLDRSLARLQSSPITRWGWPSDGNEALHVRSGYITSYDTRTRNARWVLELLTKDSVSGQVERKRFQFQEDDDVPKEFRARLDHFKRSGYDRGHLAPAADLKSSAKAMRETFLLTNISPQVGKGMNRDMWARFEKWTRDLVKQAPRVYVVTGPLFLPTGFHGGKWQVKYPVLGHPADAVHVPTHFYKVVLVEEESGNVRLGAFVMPNEYIPASKPLTDFMVPVEQLERAAGLRFFPVAPRNGSVAAPSVPVIKDAPVTRDAPPSTAIVALKNGGSAVEGDPDQWGLCDSLGCTLPEPDFWKRGRKKRGEKGGSKTSGNKSKKQASSGPPPKVIDVDAVKESPRVEDVTPAPAPPPSSTTATTGASST